MNVNKKEIFGEITEVTNTKQLEILIELYSSMLTENLVLNPCNEMYFILSLLLTKTDRIKLTSRILQLLGTIHNKIFFAAKVLETQTHFLKALDKTTLKHLTENPNLRHFSPKLVAELTACISDKSEVNIDIEAVADTSSSRNTNVCFISDTDNRTNFPSDEAFHAFRKQRDLFYEILRIWEMNRLKAGWNFSVSLGGKIKAVATLSNDPFNMVQLSRLFKAQLLNSCCEGLMNVSEASVCVFLFGNLLLFLGGRC